MQLTQVLSFALPVKGFIRLLPLSCLLLTACVTTSQNTTKGTGSASDAQWKAHQQALNQLRDYQTRGSFAYNGGETKTYAKFFWQQYTPEKYRLLLTNPLGSRELELTVEPDLARLTTKDGQTHMSDVPSELIYQLTGMEIPLDDLTAWLVGSPGRATNFTLDENHLLKNVTFEQNGEKWVLDYISYDTKTSPMLPNYLELRQGGRLIKLKMDSWTLKK
ncbi:MULTISPECIES: lipoprotein insertase outer membrane protein LolB [Providencia]|uniref:lipoprotein insertase outer membrane protein LolB n=1 Tax=Providencia TaxID=586 RepID=UPI0006138DF7|nr:MULTISPECIES: lipoprotein insertase outer membrane protein LolB [Providencia]HEC8330118.1 lipoprotein localization protein LolB [Providencia rettgeri]MBN4865145.1 lipoprotein localization protein LolB [Providencia stuartii]MBN4874629.1 lipoprotein localization protein LolB [Providencia stuartii]MBN4879158.1 lipoprotein localization protein LolB [Providencia stuartii]MBN4883830.1 lipoprotein localization protein LolB [Providencia stuartii]